jgi:uncharacterized protein (UPF0303 family)
MNEYALLLAELDREFEELQFLSFRFNDAWQIGEYLVNIGLESSFPIAIDIRVNGQQLFHAGLPGSSPDNDWWIERKSRVVLRLHRSSFYIATLLKQSGKTIEEQYGLSSAEFAPYGGSVPIRVTNAGCIGAITVSGLEDSRDHVIVVDAIRKQLGIRNT